MTSLSIRKATIDDCEDVMALINVSIVGRWISQLFWTLSYIKNVVSGSVRRARFAKLHLGGVPLEKPRKIS